MEYDLRPFTPSDIARFWSKIRVHPRTGCWEWISTYSPHGGVFFTGTAKGGDRKTYRALRLAFILHGLTPKHGAKPQCGMLGCCNPLHADMTLTVLPPRITFEYPLQIVAPTKRRYTRRRRSQTTPGTERDAFLSSLLPLKNGKSVSLAMDNPMFTSQAKHRGHKAKKLVILVPGTAAGISPDAVLVSIVGSGACIVWPENVSKVADLVLAGMPARLANVLMEKLHRLFKEK